MPFESLERRSFFDATVTEIYPGIYSLEGTSADDVIYAEVSMANKTFTLDGNIYSDVSYIVIQGNGGLDILGAISLDGPGGIACSIVGGEDCDYIRLNFDGGVWGGGGNDEMLLNDSFRGQVYGQLGDDMIFVEGECVDAEIQGGGGNDLIDCTNNNYRVVVHAGDGDDTVYGSLFNDQIYGDGGNDLLYGGDGDDSFYPDGAGEIDGGEGYDIVYAMDYQGTTTGVEEVIGV